MSWDFERKLGEMGLFMGSYQPMADAGVRLWGTAGPRMAEEWRVESTWNGGMATSRLEESTWGT